MVGSNGGAVHGGLVDLGGGGVVSFTFVEVIVHFAVHKAEIAMQVCDMGAVRAVHLESIVQRFQEEAVRDCNRSERFFSGLL